MPVLGDHYLERRETAGRTGSGTMLSVAGGGVQVGVFKRLL